MSAQWGKFGGRDGPPPESMSGSRPIHRMKDAILSRGAGTGADGRAGPAWAWCRPRADRIGLIVDAGPYYHALRESMLRAQRSILIIGWDVDGRTTLGTPGSTPDDGLPLHLRELLVALVERTPSLNVHILLWDFTVLYSLDRELMPSVSFGWATPERIHFGLDDDLPLGAAQHEKIVVIDGKVAFTGGLDIALKRWDTPEHRPADPRRLDTDGAPYQAFHDVQMAVDGEAAAVLAGHVAERWRQATRSPLVGPIFAEGGDDVWPPSVPVALRDAAVAVSRTCAPHEGRPGAQEIRDLYVDAIGRARSFIYLENQYLTATAVAEALAERLSRPDPPEVVIVSPAGDLGWLEDATMGAGRSVFLDRLRDTGAWDNVRLLCPWVADDAGGRHDVKIHSKVMVVDDRLLTIGSANVANRSMGLDCELNLTVDETSGADARGFIAAVRDRLLGEHTGAGAAAVADRLAETGSLLDVVDTLGDGRHGRGLRPLPPAPPRDVTAGEPLMRIGDPERPLDLDELIRAEGAPPLRVRRKTLRRRIILAVLLVALIGGITALWRFSPLGEMVAPDQVERWIAAVHETPWTPLVVLGLYVGLGLVVFPITVLIAGTGLVFGPGMGFVYALLGSLLSAFTAYGLGHLLGKDLLRRYAGRRVNRLSRHMGRHGILTVVVLRVAPVAPFTVINLIAGASHVRWTDFLAGTLVGMAPGIFVMTVFGTQIADLLASPGWTDVAALGGILAVWLGVSVALQRLVARRRRGARKAGEA